MIELLTTTGIAQGALLWAGLAVILTAGLWGRREP